MRSKWNWVCKILMGFLKGCISKSKAITDMKGHEWNLEGPVVRKGMDLKDTAKTLGLSELLEVLETTNMVH